jgi:hypothetical protein
MTPEQKIAYDIAERGIYSLIVDMKKTLDILEAWVLYGKMEKLGGKSAIISEEKVTLDNFRGVDDSPRP